ncbi:endolytic transglycosylase MltG [Gracilibacillus alcaliphilus]|uniref:endolytic transglycosylase MltG n=1 Tax=Gracilibacillus alcaliphilus TaxID=1401441 RepID=UPI0019593828|nr:endolytic transglycosylase MltG [Gracilibacillus alcaliphilus]MBM7679395.1 UPF0755 protein [Gracilibacillus alcaliphilus]
MSEEKKNKQKLPKYNELAVKRAKDVSVARKIILILLIIFAIIVVVGGFSAYQYIQKAISPVDPSSNQEVEITIPLGASSSDIADLLEEEGLIENSLVYRFYVKLHNMADFQAGEYTLSPSMTLEEISEELATGTLMEEAVLRVTVPEGRNMEEIATIYEENAGINQEDFLQKMQDESYIEELIDNYPAILHEVILNEDIIYPLEGYLFPATYEFFHDKPTVEEAVTQMLDKTNEIVDSHREEIEATDFSLHELLTFASLVEEEAPSAEDRQQIAAVFYNRLEDGMRLQTDPTVIYAHGEHIPRLTYDHYEIESPYNTYYVDGLPVGPIANFGESSLVSVLEPADNNYFYFLADSEGNVYYSETYEEHQHLEEEYIHSQD